MKNLKHTKGNWQLWKLNYDNIPYMLTNDGQIAVMSDDKNNEDAKRICLIDAQNPNIKKRDKSTSFDDQERLANCKLIASAPKLLEALIDLTNAYRLKVNATEEHLIKNAINAIKKATE